VLNDLLERFRRGDRLALSRLLSLAAQGEHHSEILDVLPPAAVPPRVVAITGSGGVGKSSLIGKLLDVVRREKKTVAVLACDPQSPLSGGALLGDRFRMPARPDDVGVFIRSLAAASGHGAVAQHLPLLIRLLAAFGFEVILIETVGAGQGDTVVRELADVVVLLLQPETGDDLQWEKAGVLEVADLIAINKADLPQAEQVEAQVRTTLGLSSKPPIPVLRVSAKTGEGIDALWAAIAAFPLRNHRTTDNGRILLRRAQELLATWMAKAQTDQPAGWQALLEAWRQGRLTEREATQALINLLNQDYGSPG
jgi:LAO/AO transport system ATPase